MDAVRDDGRHKLADAKRHDSTADGKMADACIVHGVDDVFFQRVVAECFGDDNVGAGRVLHLGGMARHKLAIPGTVFLDHFCRYAGHFGCFVEVDFARTEL